MPTGLRAVVLAAGHGRRLRPLTEFLPKPLLPVAGTPVAGHTLQALAALGCREAALNLHHLGKAIRRQFGGSYSGLYLTYSPEEELLGTLGALGPLREYLRGADQVLVVNGDSLCRWPLKRLLQGHRESGAPATLLLAGGADREEFGGGVGVDDAGRLVSLRPQADFGAVARRYVFAGAHVFSARLLQRVGDGPADFVADLYEPLLRDGETLAAVVTTARWYDLGTPRRYLAAARDWARGAWPRRLLRRGWIGSGAEIDPSASVRDSVVERGARVAAGARVRASLLLPGARVGRDGRVRGCILGPGAVLPAETEVEGRLVTPARANTQLHFADSVVGGLVYTPLDPRPGADTLELP